MAFFQPAIQSMTHFFSLISLVWHLVVHQMVTLMLYNHRISVVDNSKCVLLMWLRVSGVWGDVVWLLLGLVLDCNLGSALLRV